MSDVTINHSDWVYDIETYYDLFSACFVHVKSGMRYIFEVSDRIDQSRQFVEFIDWIAANNHRLFGFNNVGFDWPVCDHLIKLYRQTGTFRAIDAHEKGSAIIGSDWGDWTHSVAAWNRTVVQGDLLKIHHFDNAARRTSLKKLEINMRSARVIDLPYPPDEPTTSKQKDEIIAYMCHDVNETTRFYLHSLPQIAFRDDLATKHDLGDILNFSDGKIGEQIMINAIEKSGTPCFIRKKGQGKKPIQTIRGEINLGHVMSPKLWFNHPEFARIYNFISQQIITPDETKGFFGKFYTYVAPDGQITTCKPRGTEHDEQFKLDGGKIIKGSGRKGQDGKVAAIVDGFQYDFGTGGIHGSLHKTAIHADDEYEIWDWDVASYYPNLAITHKWFPDHLSEKFCEVYLDIFETRQEYPKPLSENRMYKEALNVPYGKSNSHFSPFYDPQYTMSITINGQLLLCMLAEWLTHTYNQETNTLYSISDCVHLLQINTDGLTIRVKKSHVEWMNNVCKAWESHTGLVLESAQYQSMWMRDVNSYVAIKTDGKIKRIGNYRVETPLDNPATREFGWHQDQSALVVRKAVDAWIQHKTPLADFILAHRDPYDFQCSVKVNRTSMGEPIYLRHGDEIVQNTSRYYVSTDGCELMKDMIKQNAKSRSLTSVEAGWTVTMTNDMSAFRWDNVNWLWYIKEAEKLIEGFSHAKES